MFKENLNGEEPSPDLISARKHLESLRRQEDQPIFNQDTWEDTKEKWQKELSRREDMVREFLEEVSNFAHITSWEILGSTATGSFTPYSDIDLTFELDDSCYTTVKEKDELLPEIKKQLENWQQKFKDKYGIFIDLSVYRF